MIASSLDFIRRCILTLSALERFAVILVMLVTIPRLCRRAHVPWLSDCCSRAISLVRICSASSAPSARFRTSLAELGKLLLNVFCRPQYRPRPFPPLPQPLGRPGLATIAIPLLLGTGVGLAFGYAFVPAVVIGVLLASHTLLGLPTIDGLGVHRLEFLGKSLFIPISFIVSGFLVNPVAFIRDILNNFLLVAGIVGALVVGKGVAAWAASRAFGYTRDERLTVWSLTLPQVAATLATALVAYQTRGAGRRPDATSSVPRRTFARASCIRNYCAATRASVKNAKQSNAVRSPTRNCTKAVLPRSRRTPRL
jgi:hypothetical protein